jgi:hypothetical protein
MAYDAVWFSGLPFERGGSLPQIKRLDSGRRRPGHRHRAAPPDGHQWVPAPWVFRRTRAEAGGVPAVGGRGFVADQRFGEQDLNEEYSLHCDDPNATLYGFPGGSATSGHHMGSYSWVVCLRTLHRTIIAAGGGGRISENDNLNAKITSARVEALGLLAGMHSAQKWKGRVEWEIDNISVISTQAKLYWLPAREWMQQFNRDVYGNLAWIQPQLLSRNMGHLSPKVTRRRRPRTKPQ